MMLVSLSFLPLPPPPPPVIASFRSDALSLTNSLAPAAADLTGDSPPASFSEPVTAARSPPPPPSAYSLSRPEVDSTLLDTDVSARSAMVPTSFCTASCSGDDAEAPFFPPDDAVSFTLSVRFVVIDLPPPAANRRCICGGLGPRLTTARRRLVA